MGGRRNTHGRLSRHLFGAFASVTRLGQAPLIVTDVFLVAVSYIAVMALRFQGAVPGSFWDPLWEMLPVIILVHLISAWTWQLYRQMWRHASVAEARQILLCGGTAAAVLLVINSFSDTPLPRSVIVAGAIASSGLIGLARFQSRLLGWHRRHDPKELTRVVVIGAGSAGAAIIREMRGELDHRMKPVVVLDDDVCKQGKLLLGVPVAGGIEELPAVVNQYRAEQALLAVPSGDETLISTVAQLAEIAGVSLKVLPRVDELMGARPSVRDVRELRLEDLLGRKQVPTDEVAVQAVLRDRVVLITGAGGSIGSEIAVQVAQCAPRRLILLDHDETHLHDLQQRLQHPAEIVLGDICDSVRIRRLILQNRPDIVFHAAAHKHVPMLEAYPSQAVATNVLGTLNVASAAALAGTKRFVFISTDKAVRPCNVLGASKWIGEQITLHFAPAEASWCAVRFGNVLGSRGSVVPTFARQIEGGGPITVTDERMKRYFMSIRESVELVLEAAGFCDGGEIFMLDMGQPVSILGLAERMVRLSGRAVGSDIPVEFTGIRPGEKLTEELYDPEERVVDRPHPTIIRLEPRLLPRETLDAGLGVLRERADDPDDEELRRCLFALPARESPVPQMIDLTTIEQGSDRGSR